MVKTGSPHKTDDEYNDTYNYKTQQASKILSIF